jgi:heptosyltransferase II
MPSILIVKTAALGDVLRTTSILPGLVAAHPGCRITWVTAPAAVDLVRTHRLVDQVEALDTKSEADVEALGARLVGTHWTRVISLDDELPLCRLASRVTSEKLSGAYLAEDGSRRYTDDVAPWFDMGLLSVHGKARADELKILNQKSHPLIYAEMLGIELGKPELVLTEQALAFGEEFRQRHELPRRRPVIGLNTGAGGRWVSKQLSVERSVELARLVAGKRSGKATFVVFGGPAEAERNHAILSGLLGAGLSGIDAGCDNALLDFAALVGSCDLLVTSDSLALHVALALNVRVVAFFAPTSAAEIELYGQGESIQSTAADYCSYRPDADNSSITPERLLPCVERQLALAR